METIDELVPLTSEDLKILEAGKTQSNLGCAIFPLAIFLAASAGVWYFYGVSFWMFLILGGIALFCLVAGGLMLKLGPAENKDVVLDIGEGVKRRIVAPVESKEIVEIIQKTPKYRNGYVPTATTKLIGDFKKSYAPLDLKYWMTIKEFEFPLTEEDYLSRFRKGAMVEFYITPHSKTILSPPVEVGEQTK